MKEHRPLFGGIEAGGTKFVLAVGHSPTEIIARHSIPTTTPDETLAQASRWFVQQGEIAALGIASFGPVDLDRASPSWGHITNTPKAGWAGCDIAGYFAQRLRAQVELDTDVNAAAFAEYRYGAGKGTHSLAYITVGTGIGGGLVLNGEPVHGAAHPEMGHIFPRRHRADPAFEGICPHHGDCLEGLASGPAIEARWGTSLSNLPEDHQAHGIIAHYIAELCHSLFAITSVEAVVLGGGVMKTPRLLDTIQIQAAHRDKDYLPGGGKHRITRPELADNSGIIGALSLAVQTK